MNLRLVPRGAEANAWVFNNVLRGEWSLERTIPGWGQFEGRASFEKRGQRNLLYEESGRLKLKSEATFLSHRSFEYRLHENKILIFLIDTVDAGKRMHELSFGTDSEGGGPLSAAHIYPCKKDKYALQFRVYGSDRFETLYKITGPKKNQCIITNYRRAAPA